MLRWRGSRTSTTIGSRSCTGTCSGSHPWQAHARTAAGCSRDDFQRRDGPPLPSNGDRRRSRFGRGGLWRTASIRNASAPCDAPECPGRSVNVDRNQEQKRGARTDGSARGSREPMEAAEDPAFLQAMRQARIRGALVGVESVTAEGLKDIYKDFNVAGDQLVARLQQFRRGGVQVLGSFIFGLPSDRPDTFSETAALADRAEVAFAQLLTPLPGTVDFTRWDPGRRLHALGGERRPDRGRRPPDALLAHPTVGAAEGLYAPPGHVRRRGATRHTARLGSLLPPQRDLAALAHRRHGARAPDVRPDLEAVPADVCQHGDRHRQRPGLPRDPVGAVDGHAPPAAVCGSADA